MALLLPLRYKNLFLSYEVRKTHFFPVQRLNLSMALEPYRRHSDNVLGRVVEGVRAQGGELVPVPQEAPIVLACVHNEPAEQPAPRLLSQGLLHLPLGHIVADVYQLD